MPVIKCSNGKWKIGENGEEITPKSGFTKYGVIKGDYIIIEGSIPGSRKRLVMLRSGMRAGKASVIPTEVKDVAK